MEEERMFSFENLEAYKASIELVDKVYDLMDNAAFPKEERFALCDQLRRAICSVPSNIAEGSGRMSAKEKVRFFEIAYGSLMESFCQLQISLRRNYITEEQYQQVKSLIHKTSKLLCGLSTHYSKQ